MLIRFRSQFVQWLDTLEHPMPEEQARAALWHEEINAEGLDAVGRALENFYLFSYGSDAPLAVAPFKKAADMAPESFMAQDLYGWALYRRKDYISAKIAFLKSLRINPAGAGAMSGLMWCGVYARDLEEAMYWSGRKADVCSKEVQAAREAGRRRYEKVNG
jgi:tetratricopeptide (TPR) repeat protein